jgi:uncharacterized protein (TIGR03435 family)
MILAVQPATKAVNRQSPAPQSAALRFEVASLKERDGNSALGLLGMQVSPGRLIQRCATLRSLLFFAYRLDAGTPVAGLPRWANTPCGNGFPPADTYEFQATMPTDTSDADMRQMMQAFLADRFKLAAHVEARNMSGYELVQASGGFKLKPTNKSEDKPRPMGALWCPDDDPRCRRFALGSAPTSYVVRALSGWLGRPVVDRTGLAETYYFDLKWASDEPNSSLPSLPTALREAFGLELKPYTGPIDTFIIDYAEKPSSN